MGRFFVDERGGCIAVRDRFKVDPEHNGLEKDLPDVVHFQMGEKNMKACPTCGHREMRGWFVPEETREEAHRVCQNLNAEHNS